MFGKTCEDRKTYTTMCDVVQDFWDGMNAAELALQRPPLPKLNVEPGEGDEPAQSKAKKGDKGKAAPQGMALQLRSGTMSTDVDDASFRDRGFQVDAVISQRGSGGEPAKRLTITHIVGQDVTVKSIVGQGGAKTLKRCQIVDCYELADTTVTTPKAALRMVWVMGQAHGLG